MEFPPEIQAIALGVAALLMIVGSVFKYFRDYKKQPVAVAAIDTEGLERAMNDVRRALERVVDRMDDHILVTKENTGAMDSLRRSNDELRASNDRRRTR